MKITNHKSQITNQNGLTIIEALVSLLVLSFGLIPALAVLSSSTRISTLIKNNLIAANLAQEGAEVVRSLRDANWFASPVSLPFQTGLIGTWRVERDTTILGTPIKIPVPADSNPLLNPPLKFDSNTGTYNYSTGTDTIFKRSVSVSMSANPCNCEIIVISRVDWLQNKINRTVSIESHLYNWK